MVSRGVFTHTAPPPAALRHLPGVERSALGSGLVFGLRPVGEGGEGEGHRDVIVEAFRAADAV